jgi:23S rRNA pseudouridine2605 synthase
VPDVAAERLSKLLAAAGVASRRAVDALIEAGRVTIDGRPATLGERIDPAACRVAVDGRPVDLAAALAVPPVHLALHKPVGVTSTVADRHAERTVLDLVPPGAVPAGARLYPVGRLDRDSEGLILLTNDGEWAERVLHPRHGVEREYAVGIAVRLDPEQRAALARGIDLEEGHAAFGSLRLATRTETMALGRLVAPALESGLAWYRVTLGQGWKRQVRRMFGAIGAPVVRLVRVRVGPVRLDVRAGSIRHLGAAEVRRLASAPPPPKPSATEAPPAPAHHPARRPPQGRPRTRR